MSVLLSGIMSEKLSIVRSLDDLQFSTFDDFVLVVEDFSTLPGCYAASVPDIIAGYWIAPTIIESKY